ncbi:MarR family winged helix-turn-helix transcriptional regulator [Streptomyces sp. NPDC050617]|uniref:MarR family winged helix-turn-helix transcriptional regulator n=1 Tax=Streptomyces sp. NPDC050617 TaxID=3154628 RepID=UPI0034289A06
MAYQLTPEDGPDGRTGGPAASAPTVDDDLKALTRLMARFLRRARDPDEDVPEELRALLSGAGLANRHLAPLVSLALEGPASVGELAERMALGATTTSQLVNELCRGGLVRRTEDERDRRRTIVSVEEPHRPLVERCARARVEPLRQALGLLAPAARRDFLRSWRVMVDVCEGRPVSAPDALEETTEATVPQRP